VGCRLEVEQKEEGSLSVSGNQCPRGFEYAKEEISAPKRIVTTTVALTGGNRKRIPVRTDKPLPVEYIRPLLKTLHRMKLTPPVRRGEVLIENFQKTDVNVISSFPL